MPWRSIPVKNCGESQFGSVQLHLLFGCGKFDRRFILVAEIHPACDFQELDAFLDAWARAYEHFRELRNVVTAAAEKLWIFVDARNLHAPTGLTALRRVASFLQTEREHTAEVVAGTYMVLPHSSTVRWMVSTLLKWQPPVRSVQIFMPKEGQADDIVLSAGHAGTL